MDVREDLYHLNEFHEVAYFDANDHKILAFDMARGPSIGIFSSIDLTNPGRKLVTKNSYVD